MSQFEGNKLKVRCVDCSKLTGMHCTAKDVKVAPKKKRSCGLYDFKGTYINRVPAAAIYVPHVDKKTRKMIRKLIAKGAFPVAEDGSVEGRDGFVKVKELDMPFSTATTPLTEIKDAEEPDILKLPTLEEEYPY